MQPGQLVLVDTNVVIEAFRVGCWRALTTHFTIETVEKCYEEALTGDPMRPGYIVIEGDALRAGLRARHNVSEGERAALTLRLAYPETLDPGERDLFAHALARPDAWIASCADRAAVNAALELGWEERLVSLEALVRAAGANRAMQFHYTERWLSDVRTTFKLDRGLK